MAILEFTIIIMLLVAFLTGVPIGVWHVVYTLRRKHRLESQADARRNAFETAQDFAAIRKELSESVTMNYQDYLQPEKKLNEVISRKS